MDDIEDSRDREDIRKLIREGHLEQALLRLTSAMTSAIVKERDLSELYYLYGNVYRKQGEFDMAMNYYTLAIEENPDTPAVEARRALHGIMGFYNKDMYNH